MTKPLDLEAEGTHTKGRLLAKGYSMKFYQGKH